MSEQWNLNSPGTPPPGYPSPQSIGSQSQNGLGVAALVFGILQFFCLPIIASVLAVVFGIMGRKKAEQGLATNGGVATAGLILGIVGLALSVITLVVVVTSGVGR